MTFYHHATLRALLIDDTWMDIHAVDASLRNYAYANDGGTPFTVNSVSGNRGTHYAVYPVPGGWHVRKFRGTTKYRLADDGSLESFFPGAFPRIDIYSKRKAANHA